MTIKEIEALSGMTRANIRFYETEGFLKPTRGKNGYRDYSETDLEQLKRIRLLRTLHFSLADIKRFDSGEKELFSALGQHLTQLEKEQDALEHAQQVCQLMQDDGVAYQTLNAQHYIDVLSQTYDLSDSPQSIPELKEDTTPRLYCPWRRFFARMLDFMLYAALLSVLLTLVFNVNLVINESTELNLFFDFAPIVVMLVVEPALLHFFGTTLGKWIFGLQVLDSNEERLSYQDAFERTKWVLFWGMGVNLIIFSQYRLWKSYRTHLDGYSLPWESDSILVQRKKKNLHCFLGALGTGIACLGVLFLSAMLAAMPKHRGDITVAQFAENYNRLMSYYDYDFYDLDENGKWVNWVDNQPEYVIYVDSVDSDGTEMVPAFTFTTGENGVVTGISMDYTGSYNLYGVQMIMAEQAFLLAQKGAFLAQFDGQINNINAMPTKSLQFTSCGVSVDYEAAFVESNGNNQIYSYHFSMKKTA
jgi:DNA-binding transcriptional MerR regulator/uncharacterized RDD family membrane protein YckC